VKRVLRNGRGEEKKKDGRAFANPRGKGQTDFPAATGQEKGKAVGGINVAGDRLYQT